MIDQSQMIDHDVDGVALSRHINKGYPDQFALMRWVGSEPEPLLYFWSPQFVERVQ